MKTPLNEMDIEDIQVLRAGTVYKVSGHAGEKLVLKSDAGNATNAQFVHARRAMKAVDTSGGNAKPLSDQEKDQLRAWVAFMKRVTDDFADNKVANFQSAPAARDLNDNLTQNPHALWTKMPFSDISNIEDALKSRMGSNDKKADKTDIHAFAKGLTDPGGLEQLGRIIAADLFISNPDRFNPFEASTKKYGGKDFKFKTIKNIGNIFMLGKDSNQQMSFSGHDFFEPSNGYRNVDVSVSDTREAYGEEWLGSVLCDNKLRKNFVKDVISDLEMILCPNRHRFSRRTKLGNKATQRLENGIKNGMTLIVAQMDRKYQANAPAGIGDRTTAFRNALA